MKTLSRYLLPLLAALTVEGAGAADEFPAQAPTEEVKGHPGTAVVIPLVFNYGPSFALIAEDLRVEFPNSVLQFNPDASSIDLFGGEIDLREYVTRLRQVASQNGGAAQENLNMTVPRPDRRGYALSFFTVDPHVRQGLVHLRAAFDILPTARPGRYEVSISGALVDESECCDLPASFQNLAVTVVPEPRLALLLLPGIALVAWRARRQAGRR